MRFAIFVRREPMGYWYYDSLAGSFDRLDLAKSFAYRLWLNLLSSHYTDRRIKTDYSRRQLHLMILDMSSFPFRAVWASTDEPIPAEAPPFPNVTIGIKGNGTEADW